MDNKEIAAALEEIGNLYIADREEFRAKAYLKAAEIVADIPISVLDFEGLEELPGLGRSTVETIVCLATTGTCQRLEELRARFPPDALTLTKIPGVGPVTAYKLCRKYQVKSLDGLIQYLIEHPGEDKELLRQAEIGKSHHEQGRLPRAWVTQVVEGMTKSLVKVKGVSAAVTAGSYRRKAGTVKDIDILVCMDPPMTRVDRKPMYIDKVKECFSQWGELKSSGERKMRLQHNGTYLDGYGQEHKYILFVDLLVVSSTSWGAALCYFTGPKEHNIRLRLDAKKQGLLVNEYGVFKNGKKVGGVTEEEVYELVGWQYEQPEQRF